jgi:phospholipase/carboxylesterase
LLTRCLGQACSESRRSSDFAVRSDRSVKMPQMTSATEPPKSDSPDSLESPDPSDPPYQPSVPIEWLPAQGAPEQLILLLHGWGEDGSAMAPLAQALRAAFPQAALLAPDGPEPAGAGRGGRQWYTLRRVDDQGWLDRVGLAVRRFQPWVLAQQKRLGVAPQATALAGFSQGAIVALETATRHDGIAGRVMAFSGRYVLAPLAAPKHTTVHLFHGDADTMVPVEGSHLAMEQLGALRGDATIDIARGIGHELHPALIQCALHRLKSHIPLRTWQAAMGAAGAVPSLGPNVGPHVGPTGPAEPTVH